MISINQIVNWKECPHSVPASTSRVRGLSPCGCYALIDWIATPVFAKDLSVSESQSCPYKPYKDNHWLSSGIDLSTGKNLLAWIKENE